MFGKQLRFFSRADQETTKNCLLCHFGIGCLQRGFMRKFSMTIRMIGRAIALTNMIRRATTMNKNVNTGKYKKLLLLFYQFIMMSI